MTRPRHLLLLFAAVFLAAAAVAQEKPPAGGAHEGDAAAIGAKLSNPISDVWALFTEFDLFYSDGNVNLGDPEVGGRMIFQPVMPFPLYGEKDARWNLITRPIIPVIFSQPIPESLDGFDNEGGLADIQIPMMVAPPLSGWLLALGPTWAFPTSTEDEFGRQQFGVGPAGVVGYMNKDMTVGVFPQYTFGIGSRSDRDSDVEDASYLSMLYFMVFNLPDAWQVGMNPTITYDDKAPSGNKWNVPVGMFAAKTTKFGKVPVKFQLGVEYSVVSQDLFGQRAQFKLNVIPVIPALLKSPILGGD